MTRAQAFFLPSAIGQRYCIYHPAQGRIRGRVVQVHPFAEELNKTRRMSALQAGTLAGAGYGVLQIDLLGCGDSSGDFADARWDAWVDDVVAASGCLIRQQADTEVPLWLWGVRGGCLLAADAARAIAMPCNLLLWQPSFPTGSMLLQQFLRLKLAADLLGSAGTGAAGAMAALKQRLAGGEAVEIAGYTLAPELAHALEDCRLDPPARPPGTAPRLCWLEVDGHESPSISPLAQRTLAAWQQAGWRCSARAVQGPAFWQSAEMEEAPDLLDATTRLLDGEDAA